MTTDATSTDEIDYTSIWRKQIVRCTEHMLAQIKANDGPLLDDLSQQAMHTLSYAFGDSAAWPVTSRLLLEMAPRMEQAGHRNDWIPYLRQGVQAGEENQDRLALAECELQLGIIYRMLSEFTEAKNRINSSLERFIDLGDVKGQVRSLNELAWLEHLRSHYTDAAQYAEKALSLVYEGELEQGMSYRILGMIAFYERDLPAAENYHRRALHLFKQHKDQRRTAWGLQNLAAAMRDQKRFEQAIGYFQQAATILWEIDDKYHWAIVRMNLGVTYYYDGQPDQALKYLLDAERIILVTNDTLQLARVYNNFGLVYLALFRYSEAETAFLSSMTLFEKLGDNAWRLNEMDGLAMVYLAQKDYTNAITVLENALTLLPAIQELPNYDYLHKSLYQHMLEATQERNLVPV